MRRFWLKCLVVLVSFALAGGNAHAALGVDAVGQLDPCLEVHVQQHAHAANEADHPAGHPDKTHHDDGCCCQCLGCTTAMDLIPSLLAVPSAIALRVHFDHRTVALATRALDPELDPPRPSALI